jgi:hypothetical protein
VPTDAMPSGACISASSEPPTDAMPAPLPGADPNALETAPAITPAREKS